MIFTDISSYGIKFWAKMLPNVCTLCMPPWYLVSVALSKDMADWSIWSKLEEPFITKVSQILEYDQRTKI